MQLVVGGHRQFAVGRDPAPGHSQGVERRDRIAAGAQRHQAGADAMAPSAAPPSNSARTFIESFIVINAITLSMLIAPIAVTFAPR